MIDHIGLTVSNLDCSRRFYEAALAPLGIAFGMEVGPDQTEGGGTAIGFGVEGNPFFWIGDNAAVGGGSHVAFAAASPGAVDDFHSAALAAGGRDNGAPGLRAHYGPGYYAAFVLDPDGINVEAVHRAGAG